MQIGCRECTCWTYGFTVQWGRQAGVTEEVTQQLGPKIPRGRSMLGLLQEQKKGQCSWSVSEGQGGRAKIRETTCKDPMRCRLCAMFRFRLCHREKLEGT